MKTATACLLYVLPDGWWRRRRQRQQVHNNNEKLENVSVSVSIASSFGTATGETKQSSSMHCARYTSQKSLPAPFPVRIVVAPLRTQNLLLRSQPNNFMFRELSYEVVATLTRAKLLTYFNSRKIRPKNLFHYHPSACQLYARQQNFSAHESWAWLQCLTVRHAHTHTHTQTVSIVKRHHKNQIRKNGTLRSATSLLV